MKVRSRVLTTAIYSGALVFLPGFLILVTPASANALLSGELKSVESSLRQAADRLDRTTERATNRITEKVVQPLLEELPTYTPKTSSTPNKRQEPLPQSRWSTPQTQSTSPSSSSNSDNPEARSGQSSAADSSNQPAAEPSPDDIALMTKPLQPVQPVQPVTVTAGSADPAQDNLQSAASLQPQTTGWIQATPNGWQILNLAWHWLLLMVVVAGAGAWGLLVVRRNRLAAESDPSTSHRG